MKYLSLFLIILLFLSGCTVKEKSNIIQNESIPKETAQKVNMTTVNNSDKVPEILEIENNSIINETNVRSKEPMTNISANVSITNKTIQTKLNQTNQTLSNQTNQTKPIISDKFIVANPIDLSQASAISKFRSCYGHDYSGGNAEGQKETQRSMKHYIDAISSLTGSTGQVKAFAPFDGTITHIDPDFASFERNKRGDQIWISSSSSSGWMFVFFHVDLLPNIKKGSTVKAGELIGYGNLDGSENFDFTLKKFVFTGSNNFDPSMFPDKEKSNSAEAPLIFDAKESPFLHMDEKVLKQYKDRGVKIEDIIISRSARDRNPCVCVDESCTFASGNPTSNPEYWVIVN